MGKGYKSSVISGKLLVHNYLSGSKSIRPYLPVTLSFTKGNLEKMLSEFPMIYIKPNIGSQGEGIFRVERKPDGYQLRSGNKTRSFKQLSQLYEYLNNLTKKKLVIQQGIFLEKVKDRPYDIRAMIQRKPKGNWTVTGIFTKVGIPNKIVTNYFQGGKIVKLEHVFQELNLSSEAASQRNQQMNEVGLKVAEVLSSKRAGMYEMGIDFAFDHTGRLWILEVNTRFPQFFPLRRIDPPMFERMLSYAHSYGRKKP